MPLYAELKAMHRFLFHEQFSRLEWKMVASFETSIVRKRSIIAIKQTTFWLSSERDPESETTIAFSNAKAKQLGTQISNDAVTQATGVSRDIKFILGFANDEKVADDAFGTHMQDPANEKNGSYTYMLSP